MDARTPAGGQPQPTSLWWRRYISPGNSVGGPQGGNGSNYGGGGGGYETGQPPGTDNGSGGNGRVVLDTLQVWLEIKQSTGNNLIIIDYYVRLNS